MPFKGCCCPDVFRCPCRKSAHLAIVHLKGFYWPWSEFTHGLLRGQIRPIATVLPRDREGRAADELHFLAGAAVVALGDLHAPEDALVLGAQLCEISESEMCHAAVV